MRKEVAARWRSEHPSKVSGYGKALRERQRLAALRHYGGDPPTCECCGEKELKFLTLDHINGGGNKARAEEKHKGGTRQYSLLAKAGFPPGYQVLCWNCNAATGLYGACPHGLHRAALTTGEGEP